MKIDYNAIKLTSFDEHSVTSQEKWHIPQLSKSIEYLNWISGSITGSITGT